MISDSLMTLMSSFRRCSLRIKSLSNSLSLAYSPHLSTRQYSRIVDGWINSIGLESTVRYLGIEVDDALEISGLIM